MDEAEKLAQLKSIEEQLKKINDLYETTGAATKEQLLQVSKLRSEFNSVYDSLKDKGQTTTKELKVAFDALYSNISSGGTVFEHLKSQIGNMTSELGAFIENSRLQYEYGEDIAKQYLSINKSLGISGERSGQITKNFKDALPETLRMGAEMNELTSIYTQFGESSGRQVVLSKEQLENMVAFSRATSVTASDTAKLYERFNLLGVSVEKTQGFIEDIMNSSNKIGVNSKKVLETLVTNMDAMQRMSFVGGVKAMTEMAQLAVKMRMDIREMLGMAEKFYEPEAAIEAAAQLQLMGGDIAQAFGDPFETMYLARNKPEELAKRLQGMTENMVEFNKETGQYELPAEARQQLEFAAKQLGLSKENVIDLAIQSSKIKDIKMNVSGNIMDKDMRETIAGMAKMKDGKWVVSVDDQEIPIGEITEEQAKKLSTSETTLKDQAKAVMTNTEAIDKNTEALKAEVSRTAPVYEQITAALKLGFQEFNTGLAKFNDTITNSETGKWMKDTSIASEFGKGLAAEVKGEMASANKILSDLTGKFDETVKGFKVELTNMDNWFASNTKSKGGVLESGGVLRGSTHEQGGIPFTVNGIPGFEAEHNEIVLTKGVYNDPIKRKIASDLNVSAGGVSFADGGVMSSDLSNMSQKVINSFQGVAINGNMTHNVGGNITFSDINVNLDGVSDKIAIGENEKRNIIKMIKNQVIAGLDGRMFDNGKTTGYAGPNGSMDIDY